MSSPLENMLTREARRCHSAMRFSIASGRIRPRRKCETCGRVGKMHGHHPNYDRTKDVLWLCPTCHIGWHRRVEKRLLRMGIGPGPHRCALARRLMEFLRREFPSQLYPAMPKRESLSPLDQLIEQEERAAIRMVMRSLSDQETDILVSRYLGLTLEQCGQNWGFTRERARQIESSAMDRIRALAGLLPPPQAMPLMQSSPRTTQFKIWRAQKAGQMDIYTFPNEIKPPRGKRKAKAEYVSLRKRLKKLAA